MAVTASSGASLELLAPLAGWVLPLAEVPDPVFAGAMAGDGVAIDPTGESLHAPCDGVIALLGANRHALTVQANGVDVLMHVGIDTMKLEGAGFRLHVRHGELVRAGQMLLEFDLDAIVRGAPSAITPVLLTGQHPGRIVRRQSERRVAVGDFLYAVEATAAVTRASHVTALVMAPAAVRRFRVPFEHGLHARPAAQVAAALANLDLVITVDTSVAHLAGAMGRPLWMLLPFAPDWRWTLDGETSPWYPTARLFRQHKSGAWDDVFGRTTAAVGGFASVAA